MSVSAAGTGGHFKWSEESDSSVSRLCLDQAAAERSGWQQVCALFYRFWLTDKSLIQKLLKSFCSFFDK